MPPPLPRPWAQTEQDFRAGRLHLVGMVDTTARREWALFTRGHATPALGVDRLRDQPEQQSLRSAPGVGTVAEFTLDPAPGPG